MRTDDGQHSGRSDVTHGLQQGCVLATGLCAIAVTVQHVFAAAIHVVLVRVGEDEGIVRDLVHLDKDGAGGAGNR